MFYTTFSASQHTQVLNSISLIEYVGFYPVKNQVSRQSSNLISRKSYGQLLNVCRIASQQQAA